MLPAIGPHQRLRDNDRLVFAGIVDSVVDLQRIRGLVPASDQVFKLDVPRPERCLIEAVVSDSCPLVGKTIREGRFRTVYNAAVIAVARNGERIQAKIGDIVLRPGDTLLLEADQASSIGSTTPGTSSSSAACPTRGRYGRTAPSSRWAS